MQTTTLTTTQTSSLILSRCKPQTELLLSSLMEESNSKLTILETDLTIETAMSGTLLRDLQRVDKVATMTIILYLIERMNNLFSINNKLNENQILVLSSDLIELMSYETIEDIVLMFKLARQGKIGGKIYRLDSMTIFQEWVPAYLEMKVKLREDIYQKEKHLENYTDTKWSDESKEAITKLSKELQDKLNENNNKKQTHKSETHEERLARFEIEFKNYDLDALEIMLKNWIKDYRNYNAQDYIKILKKEIESRKV